MKLTPDSPMPWGRNHRGKPMSEIPINYFRYIYDMNTRGTAKLPQNLIDYIEETVPDIRLIKEKRENKR